MDNGARLLLRVHEAAAALGVSRALLYRLIAAGQLRTVKIGKATRVPVEELHRFVRVLHGQGSRGQQ